jgi:hypothetical protein
VDDVASGVESVESNDVCRALRTMTYDSRASRRNKTSSAKSKEVVEDEDEDQLSCFHILLSSVLKHILVCLFSLPFPLLK